MKNIIFAILISFIFSFNSFASDISSEANSILDRTSFAPSFTFDGNLVFGIYAVYTEKLEQKFLFIPLHTLIKLEDRKFLGFRDLIYGKNYHQENNIYIKEYKINNDVDILKNESLIFKDIR